MHFRSYDALRLFAVVAQHLSFTAAGKELNLTKGAVSYQIRQLEKELGFAVFERIHNGIVLTEKGSLLWHVVQVMFAEVEQEIQNLRSVDVDSITIGASTYFASRWLSPRLMTFITQAPHVRMRLQPVIGLGNLRRDQLDLMIRWGTGDWNDLPTERLFRCPAIVTAGASIAARVEQEGLVNVLPDLTLLHDREGSPAWQDWYTAAGLPYRPKQDALVIPDPNVRVQAVINGQGIALNDWLIQDEIDAGRLFQISPIALKNYGYFLSYAPNALTHTALAAFRDWIQSEAEGDRLAADEGEVS